MSPNETAQNLTSKKKVQAEKLVRFIRALLSKNKKTCLAVVHVPQLGLNGGSLSILTEDSFALLEAAVH